MLPIEYFGYSNCTSCRHAEALIDESGASVIKRDVFKQPLSASEIRALFDRAGLTASGVLSRRSRPYASLGLAGKSLSDDEIIALMAEYPALLRRPIIVSEGKAIVGLNRIALADLLS